MKDAIPLEVAPDAQASVKREGLDLPVLIFWGLALMSFILSALLAFELWTTWT